MTYHFYEKTLPILKIKKENNMVMNFKVNPKLEPHTDDYLPISAIEACEKTKTYVEVKDKEQLKEIFAKIRAQIVAGKYSLDIHESLSPCNRQILKEYGYEIYDYQAYDAMSGTSISWNKYRR